MLAARLTSANGLVLNARNLKTRKAPVAAIDSVYRVSKQSRFPRVTTEAQLGRRSFIGALVRLQYFALAAESQAMGEVLNAAYFWMPGDKPYGALSHWYLARTQDDQGNVFPTVEHYMMYQKAILFGDQAIAKEVLSTPFPEKAKAAGRRVQGFDGKIWTTHREQIVFDGNFLKFSQHQDLKTILLGTDQKLLVEASPEDRLWGIGYSAEDAAHHTDNWGENLCGKNIQKVRDKLQPK